MQEEALVGERASDDGGALVDDGGTTVAGGLVTLVSAQVRRCGIYMSHTCGWQFAGPALSLLS